MQPIWSKEGWDIRTYKTFHIKMYCWTHFKRRKLEEVAGIKLAPTRLETSFFRKTFILLCDVLSRTYYSFRMNRKEIRIICSDHKSFIVSIKFWFGQQNLVGTKTNVCWLDRNQTFYCPRQIFSQNFTFQEDEKHGRFKY